MGAHQTIVLIAADVPGAICGAERFAHRARDTWVRKRSDQLPSRTVLKRERFRALQKRRFTGPVPTEDRSCARSRVRPRVGNARVAREVDAGSCAQNGVHQPVAGIVVGEKNRCIRIGAAGQGSIALWGRSSERAGTISGTIEGTVGGRVSRDLVYT
jgi:hypothetical protein